MDLIAILQLPHTIAFGLIVLELPLKIRSIRIRPLPLQELILIPLANILHPRGCKHIRSMSMLLPIFPLTRIDILVDIDVHAFTLLSALDPLSIVLALVAVD